MEQLEFTVSSEIFQTRLGPIMANLENEVEVRGDAAAVAAELAQRIAVEANMLIPAVEAECKTGFIARPRSARFRVEQLLAAPESLLASGAFQALPSIAQTDFREAGACLAFGLSTAAAFHALRCVEECVRWLHRSYYPGKKQNKPWGHLASELAQKARNPKPDAALLERLNHLRAHFRNPTQHPELVYDHDHAQELFYLCIEAVSSCARDGRVLARGQKARK
ncbi:MAG TPA: hypothetical protein VJ783_18290 [Pirellulales bacterium]|nr:hypothetical protein [Pirellulales bacterium]